MENERMSEGLSEIPRVMPLSEAKALFASLPPVDVPQMIGRWHGASIATGHSTDPLLDSSGWCGKKFESADIVHPLIHKSVLGEVYLNPGLIPFTICEKLGVAKWPLMPQVFLMLNPLLSTRKPRARLRLVDHEVVASAAMVYDQLPIIDHFRRINDTQLMGKMDRKGDEEPLFFKLISGKD